MSSSIARKKPSLVRSTKAATFPAVPGPAAVRADSMAFRIALDVFAVRGFQQTETDHFSGVVAEDLADRHEVPEALRHLLPLEGDEPVVHPGPGPLGAPGALADHRLALVVRELKVDAASVDVERRSEILVRHRVALHMPAG